MVVLPIFSLIFAGWLVRRIGVLGPNATSELNRFVVYLALPALLFDIIAHARWADVWQPGFIVAFGASAVLCFGLTVAIRLRGPRHLADAAIDGLNAGYSNTGFMGFPLALVAFGPKALAPTLIASIIVVCVIFAAAIVLIEVSLEAETDRARLLAKVARTLSRNPLLVGPFLGALFPITGLGIPAPVDTFLKLLSGAASPCALVALGLFLAAERAGAERHVGATTLLVAIKLVMQPVVAWVLASFVFHLSPLLTHAAVLLAALPTGTGPFMLAEFYDREADVTCKVVLVSTIFSVLTVSAYLAFAA